jgi:hypothetical protein
VAMKHFYRDVPRLGNVAVSRHAQARIKEMASLKRYLTGHCWSRHVRTYQMAWMSFGASVTACESSSLQTLRRTEERSS